MAVYISEPTEADFKAFNILTNISGITYYVSATINPILYSIMSLKFRHAFQDTLGRCLGRGRAIRRERTRMTSIYNSTLRSAGYEATDFTLVSESPKDDHKANKSSMRPGTGRQAPDEVAVLKENSSESSPAILSRSSIRGPVNGTSLQTVAFTGKDVTEFIDEVEAGNK